MGNISHGGCGCAHESAEFEDFKSTGGEVHVLIIALDYNYSKGNELTGTQDGHHMEQMCKKAGVADVETFYDTENPGTAQFPTKQRLTQKIREFGQRTGPDDYFIFFYAGHGENVPDHPPMDEDDGQDEAMVLPGDDGTIRSTHWLIDDDFVSAIEQNFNTDCKILFLFDCCHSATMCDVDSHKWNHKICSISACKDYQESCDTGHGGLLTISIEKAIKTLGRLRGDEEYSIASVYQLVQNNGRAICTDQQTEIMHANMDPATSAWPLHWAWWS